MEFNNTEKSRLIHQQLDQPGDNRIDTPILCVLTRFGLRSPIYLLPMYLDYRRTMKEARQVTGLLQSAFLIQNFTTCYSLSLWSRYDDIPMFGTLASYHVQAARHSFGYMCMSKRGGPELWSTKWRLASISNNLNWEDFDLRSVISGMMNSKPEP